MADRYPLRNRVRGRGGRARLRGGGDLRSLPRDPRQRSPVSERGARWLALLRSSDPPGARGQGDRRGGGGGPVGAPARRPARRGRGAVAIYTEGKMNKRVHQIAKERGL